MTQAPPPHTPQAGGHPDFSVREIVPEEIGPRVFATRGFGNSGWVVTDEGVVVIDTTVVPQTGARVREAVATTTDRPIAAVVYTHGHHDHVLGAPAFLENGTQVIAHEKVPERFDRYKLTRDRINGIQFGFDLTGRTYDYKYPDVTYRAEHRLELGGRVVELFHGKGETDDATIIHVPDCGAIFVGDFLIGSFPNIGNPYKVLRYEREWFETLEKVRDLKPQAINEGASLEEAIERIKLPQRLEQSPHLEQTYSRVEFAVTNIWRRYCGWFDYNPAHLLPVPRRDMAAIVSHLIGDDAKIIERARQLHEDGMNQEALELLDLVLLRDEAHSAARSLRAQLLEALAADDKCLMSRDAYLHYLTKDRAAGY